jgi:hypothetical protein
VYPFSSNCPLASSICIAKGAVDKMISHFVTAPQTVDKLYFYTNKSHDSLKS